VVSAMRHTNPAAITLVLTGYPALKEAMNAILLQADEILLKPMDVEEMVTLIRTKLEQSGTRSQVNTERVASILERDSKLTVANWLARVEREAELTEVPMSDELRTGHLPRLLHELVQRLHAPAQLGSKSESKAAVLHGKMRREQGYTVAMLVEESRILQVSIFETLQRNLSTVDFSLVLVDVMTIADEVDSQLKQAITSFMTATAKCNAA
jgi:YesN/AraC family two-component response regulator